MWEITKNYSTPEKTENEQNTEESGIKSNEGWVNSSRENISDRYDSIDKSNPWSMLNFLTSLKDYESMAQGYRWIDESSFVDEFIQRIKDENWRMPDVVWTLESIVKEMTMVTQTLEDIYKEAKDIWSNVELSDLNESKLSILEESTISWLFIGLWSWDELIKNLSWEQWPLSRIQWLKQMYVDILNWLEK